MNALATDLDFILEHTQPIWQELKNQRIFITGGTGFVGSWLLETFCWANRKLQLNLALQVLTRDSAEFTKKAPHLAQDPAIEFLVGDVRTFHFSKELFSYVIHAGTYASAKFNAEQPSEMLDTIVQGTRHTLDFAKHCHAQKFLFISSGAVYGRQDPSMSHLAEDHQGVLDIFNPSAAYAIGKLTAEHMCALENEFAIKIARCFAFVGPYFPLDRHFAIGNFVRDGLFGKNIQVAGDGTAYRSYQYAADLVIWLLHILCFGERNYPYNVGSDEAISIADLAHLVAGSFDHPSKISIAQLPDKNKLPERYIPAIQRAQQGLGLINRVSLSQAIKKTIDWHASKSY